MKSLSHEMAYRALREAINNERAADSFRCEDIAFERLRLALIDPKLSEVDRAVRLRHALRYADSALTETETKHSLELPRANGWPKLESCASFGLRVRAGGSVEAEPWRPTWLREIPKQGVDATASRASLRRWNHNSPIADPWITSHLGFNHYRGSGQALAVRSALHMPQDKTLLILLPTGEGKSLVFQSLVYAHPGQTVAVVVPTVTLAQNHASALGRYPRLKPEHPHAYIGGQDIKNKLIREAVTNGKQGLLFAAPEAIISGLRQPLYDAARYGRLAALVIDEAHLVDAWGTDFRSEFQQLSAFVAELRDIAPQKQKPRIICLSATVTQIALETLEILFSPNEPISIVPSVRLRPEPDIWVAPISSSDLERKQYVLEALRHLPRPAILYVTEQSEAERWRSDLYHHGFSNISMVHGRTSTDDREKVIESWRKGELDLVVGTSAFGLGIDYSHVRTVIHACVPESLDRYYQEIGRSGRDDCTSIALLIPTKSDFRIAEILATKKIITAEKKGFPRWEAMWKAKVRDESVPMLRFLINPSISPSYDPDMKGETHEDWNARVLNLMSMSGLISLSGLRYDSEAKRELIVIDILDDGHAELSTWQRRVEPMRRHILAANRAGLHTMHRLIDDQVCPSTLFGKLYKLHHNGCDLLVTLACGGCSRCRSARDEGWFADWPNAPIAPWPIGHLHSRVQTYLDAGRCFVKRDTENFNKARQQRRLKEVIDALWDAGVRKCIILGEAPEILNQVLSSRPWCVAIGEANKVLSSNGLPYGPELVWVAQHSMPNALHFNARAVGNERIFIIPQEPIDPANPNRPLADRYTLIPFDTFHDWLSL